MKMHVLLNLLLGMAIVCGSPSARAEESHLLAEKGNTNDAIYVEGFLVANRKNFYSTP